MIANVTIPEKGPAPFRILCPRVLLLVLLLLLIGHVPSRAAPRVEHVRQGKAASALVTSGQAGRNLVFGTAFGIHEGGFFLTSEEVVRRIGSARAATLVIRAGEKNERSFRVRVVRSDAKLGLGLLKAAKGPEKVDVLQLGTVHDLIETTEVVTFSHSRSVKVEDKKTIFPATAVHLGLVSSLRKSDGELEEIRLDRSQAAAGSTGGPALGPDGRVIGLLTGVSGTGGRVVPANLMAVFLRTPDVAFNPPATVPWEKRHEPIGFTARVTSLAKENPLSLKLTLGRDGEEARTFELKKKRGGSYEVSATPAVKQREPIDLPVILSFPDGEVRGSMEARTVQVGARTLKLAELNEVRRTDKGWTLTLRNGKTIATKNIKWKKLRVDLGGPVVSLNAGDLASMTIGEPKAEQVAVHYTLEVRSADGLLASLPGIIRLERKAINPSPPGAANLPAGKVSFEGNELVIKLPEPYASFDLGGFGRYFILHQKAAGKVVLLDILTGKIAHEIEGVPDDVIIACGGEKLILVMPGQKMLQRWSLKTFKREQVAQVPGGESPGKALLGANATGTGPLLLAGKSAQFIDITTLKPARIEGVVIGGASRYGYSIRAAADSQSFGGIPTGIGPVSFTHMRIAEGRTFTRNFSSTSNAVRWAQPTADGSLLFSTTGIFTGTLQPVAASWLKETYRYPTVDPRYFLAIKFAGDKTLAHLCSVADRRILHTHEGLGEMVPRGNTNSRYSLQRRLSEGLPCFHWIPWADLLVTMPYDGQTLHLHRIDLLSELARAKQPFIFVNSIPPLTAKKGTTLEYQVHAQSSETKTSFRLDSGPKGMTLAPGGLLRWPVPKDYEASATSIIIAVTTPSGQEVFHSFDLTTEK